MCNFHATSFIVSSERQSTFRGLHVSPHSRHLLLRVAHNPSNPLLGVSCSPTIPCNHLLGRLLTKPTTPFQGVAYNPQPVEELHTTPQPPFRMGLTQCPHNSFYGVAHKPAPPPCDPFWGLLQSLTTLTTLF